jgi:outer membrane protein OmpA-like peptidoglycan-associated protein
MKLRSTLLAATVLALPMAARAQMMPSLSGFYIGGGAGANYLQNESIKNAQVPGSALVANWGALGLGYIGYELGNGLSVQLEGDIRGNQFRSVTGAPTPTDARGWERKYGPMVNLIFDLSPYIGKYVPFAPYAGAGVGYQWTNLQNFSTYGPPGPLGATTVTSNATQGAFAYQAILGGIVPIGYTGLALTFEYRFMGLPTRNFNSFVTTGGAGGVPRVTAPVSLKLGNDFNQAVLVGFRYTFGVTPPPPPAPAPVAAPAPAPARSYLVFFDWDKATLTDRARMIIREAAENSTHVQYTQIEVNGYTDTSGKPSYNQRLSVRRAENVAAELVRDGVPRNAIAIHGFGETHLLVPTGPGVREPQNRRVEIIIK